MDFDLCVRTYAKLSENINNISLAVIDHKNASFEKKILNYKKCKELEEECNKMFDDVHEFVSQYDMELITEKIIHPDNNLNCNIDVIEINKYIKLLEYNPTFSETLQIIEFLYSRLHSLPLMSQIYSNADEDARQLDDLDDIKM